MMSAIISFPACYWLHRFPRLRLIAGREEIFHLKHAVRNLHVFIGKRAAHGRFMYADDVSNLSHGQRF